jgi:DNA-binding NtrC family response regulator
VFHIHVPPLRERREDLAALIRFLLQRNTRRLGNRHEISLEPGVETLLMNYEWPGNVREMENVVDRALIMAEENRITMSDLPAQITKISQAPQGGDGLAWSGSLREQMRRFEAALIYKTIDEAGGDRKAAAQKLNIGLSSLYRKLDEFEGKKHSAEGSDSHQEVNQE